MTLFSFFPPKSQMRKRLQGAHISMLYTGTSVAAEASSDEKPLQLWFHIGRTRLKPYHLYLQRLECDVYLPREHEGIVNLRACWSFQSLWKVLHAMDRELRWGLRFFKVCESARLLGTVVPSHVQVEELFRGEVYEEADFDFWSGPPDVLAATRQRKPRRKPAAAVVGVAPNADAAEEEVGDKSDEEFALSDGEGAYYEEDFGAGDEGDDFIQGIPAAGDEDVGLGDLHEGDLDDEALFGPDIFANWDDHGDPDLAVHITLSMHSDSGLND